MPTYAIKEYVTATVIHKVVADNLTDALNKFYDEHEDCKEVEGSLEIIGPNEDLGAPIDTEYDYDKEYFIVDSEIDEIIDESNLTISLKDPILFSIKDVERISE